MKKDETEKQQTTAAPEKPLNLREKLAAIRADLPYIEKRGHNKFHGYDYVTAADIQGTIGKILAERGITIEMKTIGDGTPLCCYDAVETKEGKQARCFWNCVYSFVDAASYERIDIPSHGEGRDTGDKASYKARTGAFKYFLSQGLCLGLGDDPEEDEEPAGRVETGKPGQNPPRSAERATGANPPREKARLTKEQEAEIVALCSEVSILVDDAKMLTYFKAKELAECPYEDIKAMLLKKKRQMESKAE